MANNDRGCMPTAHAEVLRKCRVALLRDLETNDVGDMLLQEHVITEDMLDDLRAGVTRKKRAVALLDLLPRRGTNALPVFIKALEETYEHLAKLVKDNMSQVQDDTYHYYLDAGQVLQAATLATDTTESTENIYHPNHDNLLDEEGYIQMEGMARLRKPRDESNPAQTISSEAAPTAVVKRHCSVEEVNVPEFSIDNFTTSSVTEEPYLKPCPKSDDNAPDYDYPPPPRHNSYENVSIDADAVDKYLTVLNPGCATTNSTLAPPPALENATNEMIGMKSRDIVWDPFMILFELLFILWTYLKSINQIMNFRGKGSCLENNVARSHNETESVLDASTNKIGDICHYELQTIPSTVDDSCTDLDQERTVETPAKAAFKYGLELTGESHALAPGDIVFLDESINTTDPAYTVVTDTLSRTLVVPCRNLQIHGDPRGQLWFFPVAISSKQATMILSRVDLPGCFLVYRPKSRQPSIAYNLSLCLRSGAVSTHYVYQDLNCEFSLKGQRKFFTILDLVNYYKNNRGVLACRLRRSPAALAKPEMLFDGMDLRYHIDANDIEYDSDADTNNVGRGYFGEVLRGRYNNQTIAIKVLRNIQEPWAIDDFVDEARVVSRLMHPNIVRFLGITKDVKEPRLLGEYVANGDLRRCLKAHMFEDCDTKVLLELCLQVLAALKYLRSTKYIIHRDIAARNCLLSGEANVKLCDFGLARYVTEDEYIAEMNEKVAVRWSAPEVMQTLRFSTASDIWSAAVLFWEIFSGGELPFEGLNNTQVTQVIIDRQILPRPDDCPEDVYALLKKCWHWQADKRPTAESLLEMMQQQSYFYPPIGATEDEDEQSIASEPPPTLPERNDDYDPVSISKPKHASTSPSKHYRRLIRVFKKKKKNSAH